MLSGHWCPPDFARSRHANPARHTVGQRGRPYELATSRSWVSGRTRGWRGFCPVCRCPVWRCSGCWADAPPAGRAFPHARAARGGGRPARSRPRRRRPTARAAWPMWIAGATRAGWPTARRRWPMAAGRRPRSALLPAGPLADPLAAPLAAGPGVGPAVGRQPAHPRQRFRARRGPRMGPWVRPGTPCLQAAAERLAQPPAAAPVCRSLHPTPA